MSLFVITKDYRVKQAGLHFRGSHHSYLDYQSSYPKLTWKQTCKQQWKENT